MNQNRKRLPHRAVGYGIAAAVLFALSAGASPGTAGRSPQPDIAPSAFIDPTVELPKGGLLEVDGQVYIAPFARLTAAGDQRIMVGREANVQDNAWLDAAAHSIRLGARAVVAHGGMVRAEHAEAAIAADTAKPAYRNPGIDAIERYMAAHPGRLKWGEVPAFVGFNALVDSACVSDGAMVMHLAMAGPGVTVKSGMKLLPGKRAETQEEADNPALGKAAYLTEEDIAFMLGVVEVNAALADGYNKLAQENPSYVRGINYDPGAVPGNERRDLPIVGGLPTQQPDTGKYTFRIIGDVHIGDIAGIRSGVSIRADEGPLMTIGSGGHYLGDNTIHALKHTKIAAGSNVTMKPKAVVHGGSGDHLHEGNWTEIGDGTIIGSSAVVFQSKLGKNVMIGAGSLVMDSVLEDGTRIPAGEVWVGGEKRYNVEWEPVQTRMLK